MSRAELYVNDRLVAAEHGDDLHRLVTRMCELAEREGRPHVVVNPDRSVLSVYIAEADIRSDCGFALEAYQLAQLTGSGVPLNVVFVVEN